MNYRSRFAIWIALLLFRQAWCWLNKYGLDTRIRQDISHSIGISWTQLASSTTLYETESSLTSQGANDEQGSISTITSSYDNNIITDSLTAWEVLAGNMARCFISSDLKRDSGFDGSSTGWTSWVEESSAFRLQKCIDRLVFSDNPLSSTTTGSTQTRENINGNDKDQKTIDSDDAIRWLKWMKATPAPMMVELSKDLRHSIDEIMTEQDYGRVGQSRDEFLNRIACRLILLPSGETLPDNLQSPPGAMVYGKLLYGGVTRFRILGNAGNTERPKRKAGERTVIAKSFSNGGNASIVPTEAWLQYGGPERNYRAVDIGPCGLMEITMLPKGLSLPLLWKMRNDKSPVSGFAKMAPENMVATQVSMFHPELWFDFPHAATINLTTSRANNSGFTPDELLSRYNSDDSFTIDDIETSFSTVLGGLKTEIQSIIRRVLDGRVHPNVTSRSQELQTLLDLGLSPVRGLLLYGPPGCGKTAIAREISRLLTDRPPKIVSAPELLDRWVGGSERLVRDLFADAEAELKLCNGDVTKSGLHVVVIDEVDAVFRTRSSSSGSGEVARASALNQILVKLDGVNALGNVLVIGTTNRRELLDKALLRPGRLEVQIHVLLPDKEGRREILNIYFGPLRRRGRLSQPLCRAIDGRSSLLSVGKEMEPEEKQSRSWRRRISTRLPKVSWKTGLRTVHDLASDRWTGGYSGADLEGLVRCAGSLALSRARNDGSGVDGLLITLEDVLQALQEVKQ